MNTMLGRILGTTYLVGALLASAIQPAGVATSDVAHASKRPTVTGRVDCTTQHGAVGGRWSGRICQ